MDRPALTKLLRAVEAGALDCVVVYKVDRLSLPYIRTLRSATGQSCQAQANRRLAVTLGPASTLKRA